MRVWGVEAAREPPVLVVLTLGVDERLHSQAELRRQIVFTEGSEQGDGGLVGAELRDAARTPRQVPLELLAKRRGQLTFQVVRQEAHYAATPSHGVSHGASNDECQMPNAETVHQLFGIQHSTFDINQR
jgi:hypothetical protein